MSKETKSPGTSRTLIRRDRLRQLRNEIDFSHLFRAIAPAIPTNSWRIPE